MRLYDLILQNKALTFVDAASGSERNILDFHQSVEREERASLIFLYSDNSLESIEVYLNFLDSTFAISMLSTQLDVTYKQHLETTYRPYYIYDPSRSEISGYKCDQASATVRLFRKKEHNACKVHSDIKLLLSTSGTTGSPKFVKLSNDNLVQNALSILDYLPIRADDVVPLNIPIVYVFGLSIFHTNCMKGGKFVRTGTDILKKEFWQDLTKYGFSMLGGVPFAYEMLNRIGFFKKDTPSIRYLTQAGGPLNHALSGVIAEYIQRYGKQFFLQYGQTEAAGRMAYLPPSDLLNKQNAIGFPVKNGRFELDELSNELIYYGPNVFGGYANNAEDLQTFHHTQKLYTGDLARKDEEGYYYITGRIKRITKLFGIRINLDEIELILKNHLNGDTFICTSTDDKFLSVMHLSPNLDDKIIQQVLKEKLGLPPTSVKIKCISTVPLTPNGKIDYREVVLL